MCAPPPQSACGGGLYAGPPPQPDWWVGLYHGQVGAVCCHVKVDWYESFQTKARWSLFRRSGHCWCVRGAHPVRKPVCRELGLFLGHGQVMSNDQVGDDFALALELGKLGRKALVLIQRGFRPRGRSLSVLGAGFGLSVQVVPRGSLALSIWLRTARGLRWPCTYQRTCVFICTCEYDTHVYSTVPVRGLGMGMGCVLPTGRSVRSEFVMELVRYIFRVCACGTVFGLDSPSSVSCMCMYMCVRRSA